MHALAHVQGAFTGEHRVKGQVIVQRDAGQVIAGDAVTHIDKFISITISHAVLVVAFFSAV